MAASTPAPITTGAKVDLLSKQMSQMRRIFGLNGSLEDPELEGDLAAGFRELRLIGKNAREKQSVSTAKEVLLEHYAARIPAWARSLWKAAHSKTLWIVGSLGGALLWVVGYNLGNYLVQLFHHVASGEIPSGR